MQKDLERRLVFSLFYIGAAIALLFAAQVFADDKVPPAGGPPAGGKPPAEESKKGPLAVEEPQSQGGSFVGGPMKQEERTVPFLRELPRNDYEWLGRQVWESMLRIVPPGRHRGLNAKEIHALVQEMRRNRNEFPVQLEDLLRILGTRAKKKPGDFARPGGEGQGASGEEGKGLEDSAEENQNACPPAPAAPPPQGQVNAFDLGRIGVGK